MRDEKLEALLERKRGHEREIEKQKLRGMTAQVGLAQANLDAVCLEIEQHLASQKPK